MSTRSVTQRQGLLTFDEETQNLLLYCQLYASLLFNIGIVASQNEPTHIHEVLYDPHGNLPDYLRLYRSLFARAMNQRLDRTENFWAGTATSNVKLIARCDVLHKTAYTLANPVKDRLVETIEQWPAKSTWAATISRRTLKATRPSFFTDTMPLELSVDLQVPPICGASDGFWTDVEQRVRMYEAAQREATHAEEARVQAGFARRLRAVVGRQTVIKQVEQGLCLGPRRFRRAINPRFACADAKLRIHVLQEHAIWQQAYREAFLRWRVGESSQFPVGTWALRHLVNAHPLIEKI
jgi:hypothetical protein